MALLSDLVAICAKHRLDAEPTLTVFARRLREAGRLSQAGRGRGAAQMTFLDAARFLIACAATDHPERAADAELVFSNFVRRGGLTDKDFPLSPSEAPTLDVALAMTLEAINNGTIDAIASGRWNDEHPNLPRLAFIFDVGLKLPRDGSATSLRVLRGEYYYYHPALAAFVSSIETHSAEARKVAEEAFERETYRFRTAKNLVSELHLDLLRAVADLIALPPKGAKT